MQAIITRFICPTNFRGSRYSATCQAGRVVVDSDHALNPEGNHIRACELLCEKLDMENLRKYGSSARSWTKRKVHGQLPGGEYVFVFVDRS